jgi:hypothetical protein
MARDKQGKRIRRNALRQKPKWQEWAELLFWMAVMLGAVTGSVLISMYVNG